MSKKNKYYMRGLGVGILVCALILIISRKNTQAQISDEEIISRARALGMIESGEQSLTEATGVSDTETQPSESAQDLSSTEGSTEPVLTQTPGDVEQDDDPLPEGSAEPPYPVMTSAPSPEVSEPPYPVMTAAPSPEVSEPPYPVMTAAPSQEASEPSPSPSAITSPSPSPVPSPSSDPDNDPLLTDLVYVTLTIYSGNSSDTVARRAEELGLVTNSREFDAYLVTNGYANRIRVGSFDIPLGASYEYIAKAIT